MTPQLKVLLPRSGVAYPPTEPCDVNSSHPIPIKTDHFEGEISIWVKDYNGLRKKGDGSEFFNQEGRSSMTYSLVVRGRFLTPISAEDLEFGNVFEKEIASKLPWGSSIAMKFISFVDPTVKIDAYSDKPWALSPALASMNNISIHPISTTKPPSYPSSSSLPITESVLSSLPALHRLQQHPESAASASSSSSPPKPQDGQSSTDKVNGASDENQNPKEDEVDEDDGLIPDQGSWGPEGSKESIDKRRKWFGRKENREKILLDESVEVGMEFGNGLLDFNTLSVVLPPPFTFKINLASYWDGQPATYICCSKDRKITFWSMAFQIHDVDGKGAVAEAEEEEEEEGEKEKKAIVEKMDRYDTKEGAKPEEKSEAIDTAISEDVD